jgi:hypothetical protein
MHKGGHFKQGYYTLSHPEKYVGDINKVVYRSSWELEVHKFFDNNTKILRWASEEIAIPYLKPTTGKMHRYYPDYWVEYVNRGGDIIREIIEVKPAAQTRKPRANSKHRLYEHVTLAINMAKWQAAKNWCDRNGMIFRIVTEKSIFK